MDRHEKRADDFEKLAREICQSEATPIPYERHLSPEIMLGLLDGRVNSEARLRAHAHLAVCPDCRNELQRLSQSLHAETRALEGMVRASSLPTLLKQYSLGRRHHLATLRRRILDWLTSGWERPLALATTAGMAVCLAFLLLPQIKSPSHSASDVTPKGDETAIQLRWESPELTPQGIASLVDQYSDYPTGRAIAMAIGWLNSVDAEVESEVLAFTAADTYVIQEGDTWESISELHTGNGAYWPILVLLNCASTETGELPAVGSWIRVPLVEIGGD